MRIRALVSAIGSTSAQLTPTLLTVGLCAAVAACGGGGGDSSSADSGAIPLTVPKAVCGATDTPETALQGQVPAPVRAAGFKGFNCNLQLVGQYQGEGASWQHAAFTDPAGHRCDFYDTASPVDGTTNRAHLGAVVLDSSNQAQPTPSAYLTSTAMLDPWESLRVQPTRQLLLAENGTNAAGGPELDVYDLSGDCRHPQLLSSVPTGTAVNGDAAALPTGQKLAGHEGNVSPDGLTWYSGDRGTPKKYTATDITDTTHPKLLTTWTLPQNYSTTVTTHGLTVSDDGTRAYVSQAWVPSSAIVGNATRDVANGVLILDTSQVQARVANPQIKQVSMLTWPDGAQTQHTIPITINNKPYLIAVDELGGGGGSTTAAVQAACAANIPMFPMARIIDISNETSPAIASRLMLEIHNPANCSSVLPDITGLGTFTYGSHYCSVDNRKNATTLACGYFNSGIRVFDIRDPLRPKEIAYYNPAGATAAMYGSQHFNPNALIKSGTAAGNPDWCSAAIRLDATNGTLSTTCQDNGLLVLKFEAGVWPFPETTTPLNTEQN